MLRALTISLLALILLPTFLIGCGQSGPDNLIVVQYGLQPEQWHITNTDSVERLYQDVLHLPPAPLTGGPNHCYQPWYILTFRQGTSTTLVVTFTHCGPRLVTVGNTGPARELDAGFYHIIRQEMGIPFAW